MDYKGEQEMEIEALSSIYADTLNIQSNTKFSLLISAEEAQDDPDLTPQAELCVEYSDTYPETEPSFIQLENIQNIPDDKAEELQALISNIIRESLGMAMIFNVASTLKESLDEFSIAQSTQRIAAMESEGKRIEEDENKKFIGTPVTLERFLKWKRNFDLLDLHGLNASAAASKGKLSGISPIATIISDIIPGRQLFEKDASLIASDNAYTEEGDVLVVDMSLFEREFDNLDVEAGALIPGDSDSD